MDKGRDPDFRADRIALEPATSVSPQSPSPANVSLGLGAGVGTDCIEFSDFGLCFDERLGCTPEDFRESVWTSGDGWDLFTISVCRGWHKI